MAAHHARSNSIPSRQHPIISEFDQQLSRLRSSQEASSSTSIATKLSGLQDLHDFVHQLLLLPLNQQALQKDENKKQVDELLDGSLRILDLCSTSRDALSQIKESVQEIQSIFRRRSGGESDLATEVKKILASRKTMKKSIRKTIGEQKSEEVVDMLREVESITLGVFESLFSFISGPKSQKSLISKIMNSKRVFCEEVNELEIGVASLQSLISQKTKKSDNLVEEKLKKMEMCVQDLEEGVENLSKRLIKTRVSLLNILSY